MGFCQGLLIFSLFWGLLQIGLCYIIREKVKDKNNNDFRTLKRSYIVLFAVGIIYFVVQVALSVAVSSLLSKDNCVPKWFMAGMLLKLIVVFAFSIVTVTKLFKTRTTWKTLKRLASISAEVHILFLGLDIAALWLISDCT